MVLGRGGRFWAVCGTSHAVWLFFFSCSNELVLFVLRLRKAVQQQGQKRAVRRPGQGGHAESTRLVVVAAAGIAITAVSGCDEARASNEGEVQCYLPAHVLLVSLAHTANTVVTAEPCSPFSVSYRRR